MCRLHVRDDPREQKPSTGVIRQGRRKNQDEVNYRAHCCGQGELDCSGRSRENRPPRHQALEKLLTDLWLPLVGGHSGGINVPALLSCAFATPSGIRPCGLLWPWRSQGKKQRCAACSWKDRCRCEVTPSFRMTPCCSYSWDERWAKGVHRHWRGCHTVLMGPPCYQISRKVKMGWGHGVHLFYSSLFLGWTL